MYKEVLRAIGGIGIYQVISLIVFMLFFLTVLLWIFRIRKSHAHHMAQLPFDDGTASANLPGDSRHG